MNNREFTVHDFDGNRRLNLLEGPIDPPADPPGTRSFAIEMNNVSCIIVQHQKSKVCSL